MLQAKCVANRRGIVSRHLALQPRALLRGLPRPDCQVQLQWRTGMDAPNAGGVYRMADRNPTEPNSAIPTTPTAIAMGISSRSITWPPVTRNPTFASTAMGIPSHAVPWTYRTPCGEHANANVNATPNPNAHAHVPESYYEFPFITI